MHSIEVKSLPSCRFVLVSFQFLFNLLLSLVELLDEEEFGEAAESITHDENSTKAARDLGLMVGTCINECEKKNH